ncbi:MAG: prolyl-tRNA synthetase, partial [Miltoncostaeaceae bacterium]|nr:prolyl-tRNA synthetase [Miltoncostaeaceae bacterium]
MAKAPILTPQSEDFPRWYQDILARAELAESGPVRGTMVIRPYGYSLWERMQRELDERIAAAGARNAYFPLLIPESYLRREAEHVEGFSPELAVVTHAGGKQLEEPVVIRPTSETVINEYFSKWIQSYRDLPLLINQWANVVRWELRPRAFLRTTEFLWQEGHTAHATEDDARRYAERILHEVYEDFMVHVLAVPIVAGRKTARERFAGAVNTMTCEGMMRDGKALQMATSHELGQNFARAFETRYLNERGELEHVWTTSWGASTRLVGALIMAHGDDAGLRVPPRLAPIQVVVLVVRAGEGAEEAAAALAADLRAAGLRAELDARADVSFGRRAIDWELKGVPVRVEVGPRDLAEGKVTLVRRDRGEKVSTPVAAAAGRVGELLVDIQRGLLDDATRRRDDRTTDVSTLPEALDATKDGFAR